MITPLFAHGFAAGDNTTALLGTGWAQPDAQGVWSQARRCEVKLPGAAGPGPMALEIELDSQVTFGVVRTRRIKATLNGRVLGECRIGGKFQWRLDVPVVPEPGPWRLVFTDLDYSTGNRQGVRLCRIGAVRNTHAPLPPGACDLTDIRFSWNDATADWLDFGWGHPEDAYVWAVGGASEMRVPVPPAGQPMLALLDMHPFIREPRQAVQRVVVSAGGTPVAALVLKERLTVAIGLRPAPGDTEVALGFRNLDADFETDEALFHFGKPFAWFLSSVRVVPALPRFLPGFRPRLPGNLADGSMAQAVATLTGLAASELVERFEGLGNGCELGQLQQSLGCDRSDLLRFSAIRQRELVEGLLHGFHGVARADRLKWEVRREEDDTWRLIEETYGVSAATPHSRAAPAPGFRLESRRLPRLADKLMEDVAAGEKIFVLRLSEPHDETAALAVLAALRHFGDADMVWLVTDGTQAPGSAERLPCGLVRGHLEAPTTGRQISGDTMLSALANALTLLRQAAPLPP